ncbi:MAG: hypothetical protein ACI4EN_01310 [Butyrivibrio sp.]
MSNLFLTDTSIPKGFEYILDKRLPFSALSYSIVGIILIVAAMIGMIITVRKREKGSLLSIFAGIAVFMIFNYFLVMVVTSYIPADNMVFYIILAALVASVLPFLGRLVVIKLFSRQYNGLKEHLGYGTGIMDMKAVTSLFVLLMPIGNYYQISKYGVEYFFPADLEAELALSRAESIASMLEFNYTQCLLVAIISIGIMVQYLAASLPIYAAFSGRKSKGWFAFALGTTFLTSLGECMFNNDILVIFSIILVLIVAAVSVYFAVKLYKELADKTQEPENVDNNKTGDISKNAHVKIPRFKNLDEL